MAMNRAESPPMMLPFRAAEKGADERLTYDVPEAGQGLDARRRPPFATLGRSLRYREAGRSCLSISGPTKNCGLHINWVRSVT
jgi:hypothetical protein